MKNFDRIPATLAVVLLVLPAVAGSSVPADVREALRARVEADLHVGLVVGLVTPEGAAFAAEGSTTAQGETKVDEHTVFEIGSLTKVFTGLALARMVEKGQVALDDPVARHVPEGVTVPTRGERPMRLVDLATHTSGLPRMPDNLTTSDFMNPYADYSEEQMWSFLSGHTLRRAPGEAYEYSNYGAGLLGQLLARRAGSSYEELVTGLVLGPLGMKETAVTLTPALQKRLAVGHVGTMAVKGWDMPALEGAGALHSTAADLARFVAACLGAVETELAGALRTAAEPRFDAGRVAMGLGWHIVTHDDRMILVHSGETGGYRSFVGVLTDGSAGAIVLTNTKRDADDLGRHLLAPSFPLRPVEKRPPLPLLKERPASAETGGSPGDGAPR